MPNSDRAKHIWACSVAVIPAISASTAARTSRSQDGPRSVRGPSTSASATARPATIAMMARPMADRCAGPGTRPS